ncbi:hypothetical protein HRI_002285100 [Hibiscus trionum]|uniref:Zinc-ribbon domain-containing protein n=1 Tax=Hibiscus trionum TaxID=183268 RepID=A0A9W7HZ97_HIBTR|nr:hypothetical protein HRI_002285100 [Hibiscus trionum]
MAGGTISKVRLVRCPKCRLVLQEIPDFPVYKCGGCDTILVAKEQKPIADTTSSLQHTEAAGADTDRLKKDRIRNTSSDSDSKKLDENGSNKGEQSGNGEFQLENLDICNVEREGVSNENVAEAEANEGTLQLDGNDKTELHVFDRLRSVDTFEAAEFGSPSSGLSASDDRKLHSSKNSYLLSQETRRRDKLPGKGKMNGSSDMQDPATNLSSDFSNKKHYAAPKFSMGHRDEPLEPVMHHRHPPRSSSRLDTDERPLHIPLSRKASLRGYECAGPSRESQDKFPSDSTFYPHEKIECTEQENMKLLRMLYELQDQITKTCHLNGRPSTDVPWSQNHFPTYCCQEPPGDENFYPRHHGRHGPNSTWSQQSRFTPMPFSGGEINTRYSIDSSCLCCHPQDWRHSSEQLHPPIFRHKRELCRADPGHISYNSYSPFPSSPLRYLESDFSNQRYRDHELKRYLREKHHSVRRHLLPTAGGAPFVTCYYCFTPLQLPADFLLFKRRLHQLRCGACTKVLKFSLLKGIHIVPYEVVATEPPPSEVDDCSDAINARISTLASCSLGVVQADPVSYSDDYGRYSFCKSCSTDGDPVSYGSTDAKTTFCSSYKPRKNFIPKQSQREHRTSKEAFDSAEPLSSEVEELPPRSGGTSLHHLMGYSSPSQLIDGFVSSISGSSSVHSVDQMSETV